MDQVVPGSNEQWDIAKVDQALHTLDEEYKKVGYV